MKNFVAGLLIASSGLAALVAQDAFAGNRAGAWTFTPGAGYYWYADKRHLNDTGSIPTLALAYDFDSRWGIEGAYAKVDTSFNDDAAPTRGHVTGNLYSVDVLHHCQHGMFEPYVAAGLGALNLSRNGTSSNTQANIHAGLGTQIFFDENIALRGEVRDLYTISGGKNDVMVNFGVSFLFGGNEPVHPISYKGEDR